MKSLGIAFAVVCLISSCIIQASTTQPTADSIAAAAIAGEKWIQKVDSFYVKLEGEWTVSPERIARRTAELKKQFPDATIDAAHFSELREKVGDVFILAFDKHRVYRRTIRSGYMDDTRIFDGQRAMAHEKYDSGQNQYAIQSEPREFFNGTMVNMSWPRIGLRDFWFDANDAHEGYRFDKSMRYTLAGRQMYRGVDCWVVEKEFGWEKWFVGVDRPLVWGYQLYATPRKFNGEMENRQLIARRHGVTTMPSENAWYAWMKTRTAAGDSEQINEEYWREMLKHAYPNVECYTADWKEVAPGRWFPMTQGTSGVDLDADPVRVTSQRVMKVTDIKVDQPLDDSLFKMEFEEGVEVFDRAHNPPLSYKYKKKFTDAEWKAIVDKAQTNQKFWDDQKKAQNAIIGKVASVFPEKCMWINSKPLTWSDWKGQVVLVDFFADWCGPCRNDLPVTSELYKKQKANGFAILAIHPPGSERASIDKVIKEFDLQYPICIDIDPPAGVESWGMLYAAYGVKSIPHAVVVDKDGKIAGQGSLAEMIGLARTLVSQPAK